MKTPKEQVDEFIDKKVKAEYGKWDAGKKNHLNAWESFKEEYENTASLKEECRELSARLRNIAKYLKKQGYTDSEINAMGEYYD